MHPGQSDPPSYNDIWRPQTSCNLRYEHMELESLPGGPTLCRNYDHSEFPQESTPFLSSTSSDNGSSGACAVEILPAPPVWPGHFQEVAENVSQSLAGKLQCELTTPEHIGNIVTREGRLVSGKPFLERVNSITEGREWQERCSVIGWLLIYTLIIGLVALDRVEYSCDSEIPHVCIKLYEQYDFYLYTLPISLMVPTIVIAYYFLIREAMDSLCLTFLKRTKSSEEVVFETERGRQEVPKIELRIMCWHKDQRYGKIPSIALAMDLPLKRCIDASGDLNPHLFRYGKLTRFEVSRRLCFLNEASIEKYDSMVKMLQKRYRNSDHKCDVTLHFRHGYGDPIQTVYVDTYKPSMLLHPVCYWLWTLAGFAWGFRLLHKALTNRVKFTYLKVIEIGDIPEDLQIDDSIE